MLLQTEYVLSETGIGEYLVPFDINKLKAKLLVNEPMSNHTTWRVGGIADYYYKPTNTDDLIAILKQVPEDMAITFVGYGSNLLVRDGGIRGLVIALGEGFTKIEKIDVNKWKVGAGAACARVAKTLTSKGYKGAEFLIGIPGTMGGALAMNAGAYDGETWSLVESVETVNKQGELFKRSVDEFQVAYRQVISTKDEWFLSCQLKLEIYKKDETVINLKTLLAKRSATQPLGQASCGSVFRNPDKDYAARLIEESGLKGFTIGGAVVSEKHANFIINNGNATAKDIEDLIHYVQAEVNSNYGINLHPEAKVIGEYTKGVDVNE